MRRYRLNVDEREFVIDVQELGTDNFSVMVGDQTYQVSVTGDEDLQDAVITPGMQTTGARTAGSRFAGISAPATPASTAAKAPAGQRPVSKPVGGGASLNAPMPGVIIELHVKAGDVVTRGQQVAVLDAMKMHNLIGAPRAGTIAEVCVAAGQVVGHGDPIVRFADG